ncbi:hypothetical protein NUW58_g5718 [Xylaria curta]|uniref:Uncharacterized protein n=1 Tax=Xylaria curta TaxID=42375 RepID=A0ACC1P117_9PEZI|nr:hypothetical protein NUW58_g5718 [Xylaria curta]
MPGAYPHTRPRSTSPTRSSSNDGGSEDSIKTKTGINRAAGHNSQTAQSRAGERYKPKVSQPADIPPQPATTSQKFMSSSTAAQPNGSGPSVYDPQIFPTPTASSRPNRSCERPIIAPPDPSSEENPRSSTNLLPLEEHQRRTLDRLLRNYSIANESGGENDYTTYSQSQHALHYLTINNGKVVANSKRVYSFNFSDGVNAANTSASYKSFARNSAENINTRFVDDDVLDDWQFKAGSASANEATTASKPRPPSRNRPNRRQTPLSKPTLSTPMPEAPDVLGETNTRTQGFSAGAWSEQIGPQHFEPQSSKSASTSPTRRAPPKKPKSFKMTAGTAAVVDDDESEERQDVRRYSPGPTPGPASMAPDAMDIDTPPADKTEEIPEPVKVNGARKYSTEPYRADWRAGDVNGVASKTAGPPLGTAAAKNDISETKGAQPIVDATKNCSLRHGGSEDSEEFRTTFSEFKNVEPFMDPSPSGLKSFADLRSTLPFESRPSEQIPLDTKPPVGPLEKYAQDFGHYMDKWEIFNDKVLAHFTTRQEKFKLRRSQRGAKWLEDCVPDYITEVDQDLDVQKKHTDACVEHRKRIAEFMEFRDRVRTTRSVAWFAAGTETGGRWPLGETVREDSSHAATHPCAVKTEWHGIANGEFALLAMAACWLELTWPLGVR